MTLTAEAFLRRFLLHTLPRGFVRIRFFGLMTHRRRAALLPLCRQLLGANSQTGSQEDTQADKPPAWTCPLCGGPMVVVETLTAQQIFSQAVRQKAIVDTS